MRIAHFVVGRPDPDSPAGVFKSVYFLARAQAALGHEVAVFAVTNESPIPIRGVLVRTYAPSGVPFLLPRGLGHDLEAWNATVVHMHSAYVPSNVALARRLRGRHLPYVVAPRGALSRLVLHRRAYLKYPYRLLCELPCLNRAAFVHAIADEADIRAYGVKAPIVVAPNAIDLDSVPRDLNPEFLSNRVPTFKGRRALVFLGRLDQLHKGLDLLLRGLAQASESHAELALALVGPDWRGGKKRLEAMAHRLGLNDRVVFWGPSHGKEKFDLLASADVFVHPSRWEAGVPHAVMEALACGTPCVVTPAADPLGLISAHDAGIVVEPTPGDIARALVSLSETSHESLVRKGRHGRQLVEQEFSWRRTAETLERAFERFGIG